MKLQVIAANFEFHHRPFLKPLRLSSGVISEITEARATVTVRVDGHVASGRGAIYLSELWAWREGPLTHDQRDQALRGLCRELADALPALSADKPGHPLELSLKLRQFAADLPAAANPSALARLVCASPLDAALHDAAGYALDASAFDFYQGPGSLPIADRYFPESGGARAAIQAAILPPQTALDAWLIVGPTESLDQEIAPWVRDRGYHGFKLKTLGQSAVEDAARVSEVFHKVREYGAASPRLSVDSNEAHESADAVEEFLHRLRESDPEAFAALEYLEQPISRAIPFSQQNWHGVARMKPVVLDEGLTDPAQFADAADAGYSGFALKTCKGHGFTLLCAAWARRHGMLLTMQDLTNPGLAAIQSALTASRIHPANGIELNAAQHTPAANSEWLPALAPLLAPTDGVHRLPAGIPFGLGSRLEGCDAV